MQGKVLFIGRFSRMGAVNNKAASAAGDIVQRQIIADSIRILGSANFEFLCMEPKRCWPRGEFYVKGGQEENGGYISYVNLPVIRNIIFMFFIVVYCFLKKNKLIFQYNSYFFENIGILVVSFLRQCNNFIIIQDFRSGSGFSKSAQLFDKVSNSLVKYFDFALPITSRLAQDLKIDEARSEVFIGGMTQPGYDFLNYTQTYDDSAVFAGALEAYNGLDKILVAWSELSTSTVLHVFGRGSLSLMAKEYADRYSNVVFHGFVDQEVVSEWQKKAKFNICLRYSSGIEEDYFFPSKFFNTSCGQGLLLVNNFKNIPCFFRSSQGMLKDDLSNLSFVVSLDEATINFETKRRREYMTDLNSWYAILSKTYNRFGVS